MTAGYAAPAEPYKRKHRKPGFVEKTLAGISASIEGAIFSEHLARQPGFLQRRDPRVKVVAFVVLVLAAGLSQTWEVLAGLGLFTMLGVAVSRVSVGMFIKRVWLGIPLFSAIVVVPSLFLVGGQELFSLPLGFFELSVSREALHAAGIFVLRVGVSVSLATLLVLTTTWSDLLKSLRFFRVPNVFVLILAMTYRYIFLFLHTVNGMFLARKSRIVAHTTGREQRWWIVSSMGVLMSRSFRMSDEVYQAMLARGFNNRFQTLTQYAMRPADWALGAGSLVVAVSAVAANRWIR